MPACVAAAPGGPTHVLLNDDIAEHIPGCNMAFRRETLRAGRRLRPGLHRGGRRRRPLLAPAERGWQIGFSPAAMVWHFRRNTVKAYLRQQRGYGKAEALLYFKHPYRFNMLGQSRWLGRIYGDSPSGLLSRRPVIYYGTFGSGLFQTLYEPPARCSRTFRSRSSGRSWRCFSASARSCRGATSCRRSFRWQSPGRPLRRSRRDESSTRRYQDWRSRALLAIAHLPRPAASLLRALQMAVARPRQRGAASASPSRDRSRRAG